MAPVYDHKGHQLFCIVAEFSVCETQAKSNIIGWMLENNRNLWGY